MATDRDPSWKRPASRIEAWLDEFAVSTPRDFLANVADVAWLSETYDAATPELWHELRKRDGATASRASTDRQFAHLKEALVIHGVPHERVTVGKQVGIRIKVSRAHLEAFARPLKRCMRKTCPAHEKPIPARFPWFYRNAGNADGLRAICAACSRSRPQTSKRTASQREAERRYNASAAGRARTAKFNAANGFNCRAKHATKNHIDAPPSTPDAAPATARTATDSTEDNAAPPATLPLSSLAQQHSPGTDPAPMQQPMSINELSAHLSSHVGIGKVTRRMITYLLEEHPEYEPPRMFGNRAFGPENVAKIRAHFEARRARAPAG